MPWSWETLLNWRTLLEILILTVGIYYALRFVRGTRGAPVVTGFLVVLLALGLVSFLLKLKVLQYFLGGFSAFTALAVLVIFQPELRRILAPGGALIVVTPTPRHLAEVVGPLGLLTVDERKPERLAAELGTPVREQEIEARLSLPRDDVEALVAMGPSAHHVDSRAVARAAEVTLSVRVAVYGR